MPDNPEGQSVESDSAPNVVPAQAINPPPPPDHPNPQPTEPISNQAIHADIQQIEDRVKRAEWMMIGLTAAIAFFALCSIVVGIFQWCVMNGQLQEMRSGGIDTHNLAIAAGNQATWTQNLATNMQTQADRTKDLADQMRTQASATQQMADDNGNLLRGTQAASMYFSVGADVLSGTVSFSGRNEGKVEARDIRADLLVDVRNWPSKKVRLGPFNHLLSATRVANNNGPREGMQDQFAIPNITPNIADELRKGEAYITVQWQANYDSGFGNVVRWPAERTCEAYMYIGHVKCQTGPRSFLDNDIRGDSICGGIDELRKKLEDGMRDNQNQCQKPN